MDVLFQIRFILGSVFDMTQSYDVPFWLAGIFLFISSAISFMVPCVRRWVKRKEVALTAKTAGNIVIFRKKKEKISPTVKLTDNKCEWNTKDILRK